MVHIPTTQRQFFNTGRKANTFGMAAQALLPAAQQYKQTLLEQQKVKIDTLSTKARIDIDNKVNQWRLDNQSRPDDPEAKMQLQSDIQEILSDYGKEIDPIAQMDWDMTANKLASGYEIAQNQWVLTQRAENAKLDVAENINANLNLARSSGKKGNLDAGLADYVNSYKQLYSYASQNMGETEARKLLRDYEEDFMGSFINGLAETDPKKALEALQRPEIAASFKNDGAHDMMLKIVNKQIKFQDFQRRVAEFETEAALSEKLDNLNAADGLKILEENEGKVSSKYYKAKRKALMSDLGITAETQADEAAEIILDIAGLDKEDVTAYYQGTQNILAKIEDKYARGMLSTADRKRLINQVVKGQGKNIEVLKENNDGAFLWWGFSYKDASDYIADNYTGANGNKMLLDYFKAVSDGDYDAGEKKRILQGLIEREKQQNLDTAVNKNARMLMVGDIKSGYRYLGGDASNPDSWEKI